MLKQGVRVLFSLSLFNSLNEQRIVDVILESVATQADHFAFSCEMFARIIYFIMFESLQAGIIARNLVYNGYCNVLAYTGKIYKIIIIQ